MSPKVGLFPKLPGLPLRPGATVPDPGFDGALCWSSSVNALLIWMQGRWVGALPTSSDEPEEPTVPPPDIAATGALGTPGVYAAERHTHGHGIQAGGNLHAAATTTTAGFASATDKVRIDGAVQGPVSSIALRLARFNDTTGKSITDSLCTLDNAGLMTLAGNLSVNGNIAVTGTVDGVDVSALNATVASLSIPTNAGAVPAAVAAVGDPGTIGTYAREGHVHPLVHPTAGAANAYKIVGSGATLGSISGQAARVDHTHDHNDIAGSGTVNVHHAAASDTVYGFLSPSDFGKLKKLAADASTAYAPAVHTHPEYALNTHNHDAAYAAIGHNHSGVYAPVAHTHAEYSLTTHNHDTAYAPLAHSHPHGDQVGGTLHALAIAGGAAGFVSGADQSKLSKLATDPSTAYQPAGSYAPLSHTHSEYAATTHTHSEYALSTHSHPHGDQAGGTLHAPAVAGGAAGFLIGTDKSKIDSFAGIATASTATGTVAIAAAGNTGSSTSLARLDHTHAHNGVSASSGAADSGKIPILGASGTLAAGFLSGHNHDSAYATLSHNHDGVYQPAGSYAATSHNHDSAYAALSHNHSGVYQPANANLVTCAVASTATQVPKFADATGKTLTTSGVTIDASNNIAGAGTYNTVNIATLNSTVSSLSTTVAGKTTGPANSVANQVAKFSDTTGKTLINSGVVIDGSNNLSGIGTISSGAINGRNVATDGAKLDGIQAGATNTAAPPAASNATPVAVTGTGSTPGTASIYAREGHQHAHGDVGATATVNQFHYAANGSYYGFMSPAHYNRCVNLADNANSAYAAAGHNHSGVYQPAGSYAAASHNHDITYRPKLYGLRLHVWRNHQDNVGAGWWQLYIPNIADQNYFGWDNWRALTGADGVYRIEWRLNAGINAGQHVVTEVRADNVAILAGARVYGTNAPTSMGCGFYPLNYNQAITLWAYCSASTALIEASFFLAWEGTKA